MERKANYALVGFASLVLFVGVVIFAVWLTRIQFNHPYNDYQIVFPGPVSGVSGRRRGALQRHQGRLDRHHPPG